MIGRVASLSKSPEYTFTKPTTNRVRLIEGVGVEGDIHSGETVKHRSRMRDDPTQPNLRQVHLITSELLAELRDEGFEVSPGRLGENLLTEGLDLLALPTGTRLEIGGYTVDTDNTDNTDGPAVLEMTGLRNPCGQLDDVGEGLMKRLVDRAEDGSLIRKAGAMAIVRRGGEIALGDSIRVVLPPARHLPLEKV